MKASFTLALTIATNLFISPAFAHEDHGPKSAGHLVLQDAANTVHAHLDWVSGPVAEQDSVLKVEFKEPKKHQPTDIKGTLTVTPFMPAMHHGTKPTTVEPMKDASGQPIKGAYKVTMFFSMAGDWDVKFTITGADGKADTKTWKVAVPEAPAAKNDGK